MDCLVYILICIFKQCVFTFNVTREKALGKHVPISGKDISWGCWSLNFPKYNKEKKQMFWSNAKISC